jgi:hypothetical protein
MIQEVVDELQHLLGVSGSAAEHRYKPAMRADPCCINGGGWAPVSGRPARSLRPFRLRGRLMTVRDACPILLTNGVIHAVQVNIDRDYSYMWLEVLLPHGHSGSAQVCQP